MTFALDKLTSRRLESCLMATVEKNRPGQVRDAILKFLKRADDATVVQVRDAVTKALGRDVPASSVRSYLNLNVGVLFERVERGRYRLKR